MIPVRSLEEHDHCRELATAFKAQFGRDPKFVAMAPGRVNLIGEHIDYCGYSVLPIALDRSIRLACDFEVGQSGLHLSNVNEKYPTFQSDTLDVEIDTKQPKWHMYFVCGYRAIVEYAEKNKLTLPQLRLTVLAQGDVPPNAGLSSSSALVVASAILVARAASLDIPKVEMAQLCACAERHIGTQGGGMDQTVSLMAEAGKALLVHFGPPLTVEPRQLPSDVRFVVANSCVEVNKAAGSDFNERVVECRLAAKILSKRHAPEADWRRVRTLKEAQLAMGLGDPQSALDAVYRTLIHEDEHRPGDGLEEEFWDRMYEDRHGTWTRAQVLQELQIGEEELQETLLSANTRAMCRFHLGPRAKHVFSEAERTEHMARLCKTLEGAGPAGEPQSLPPGVTGTELVHEMGRLLNRSHQSLDRFYECSHPEVNQLIQIARDCGSIGSRITGAGWGGCTIHMVEERKVGAFVEALRTEFYERRHKDDASALFVMQPGPCAGYYV